MYLDPRVPQSKEVPTLLTAGGAPTEGESGDKVDPALTDSTEWSQFQRARQGRKRWQ